MNKLTILTVAAAALLTALPVLAEEVPAATPVPQMPQSVTIPMADLQAFADKLGEVPMKYAAPLGQELQRIVMKNMTPVAPPAAPEKPAKK